MSRSMSATPDEHLQWGDWNWRKFDEGLHQFDDGLARGKVDSHALLKAYRHAFGAEINYADARGAHEKPHDTDNVQDAYEQAKEWRKCLCDMIAMMLDDCPQDVIAHHFRHCIAEMNDNEEE